MIMLENARMACQFFGTVGYNMCEQLDSRFAGRTVVSDWRGLCERADILLGMIERHMSEEVAKKYDDARQWIGNFENLGENDFEMLMYATDEMIDDIGEIAPEGTYFGVSDCGGCLGFWYIDEAEVQYASD